jgi:hypothetical protein
MPRSGPGTFILQTMLQDVAWTLSTKWGLSPSLLMIMTDRNPWSMHNQMDTCTTVLAKVSYTCQSWFHKEREEERKKERNRARDDENKM